MTLSVMDELGFTSASYDCTKCPKLDTDLKTSKLENAELRKLLSATKTQADKTGALLQKFTANKKTMHLQKQTILNLEKQYEISQSEAATATQQLKQHLLEPSTLTKDEHQALLNDMQSHKGIIKQLNSKVASLDDELQKTKAEKNASEKKCKSLERAQKTPDELEKMVATLNADVTKLKRENFTLRNSKESTINNLADKKNKDIMKKLSDMTDHQKVMEDKMKEILDTVKTSSVISNNAARAGPSYESVFKKPAKRPIRKSTEDPDNPAKKKGRPPKKNITPRNVDMSNSDASDFDIDIPRPVNKRKERKKKSTAEAPDKPLKKRGRPVGYSPKFKKITQKKGLSNSDSSDSDLDLIDQLEDSFNCPLKTNYIKPKEDKTLQSKQEPLDDTTLVCDVLTNTSDIPDQFSIFGLPSTTQKVAKPIPQVTQICPKLTLKKLDVENMFDIMTVYPTISPIPCGPTKLVPEPTIKTERTQQSNNPTPMGPDMTVSPKNTAPIKSNPKLTPAAKRTKAKSIEAKLTEPKLTAAKSTEAKSTEAKSTEARSTEAKSTEAKSIEQASPASKPTTEVEASTSVILKSPVKSHCTKTTKRISKPPTNSSKESLQSISAENSPFLPIVIKNDRMKFKSEPSANVLTIKPISRQQGPRSIPAPALTTIGNMLSQSDTVATIDEPDLEIINVVPVQHEETSVLQNIEAAEDVNPSDKELAASSVPVGTAVLLNVPVKSSSDKEKLYEDDKPSEDGLSSGPIREAVCIPEPLFASPTESDNKGRLAVIINELNTLKKEADIAANEADDRDTVIILVPEETMLCAFEMDVGVTSRTQSSQSEGQSDSAIESDCTNSGKQHLKKMERLNKKLFIDASFETPKDRRRGSMSASETEDNNFVLPKRTRNSRSSSCKDPREVLTKTLRNRKISISDDSSSEFKSPRKQRGKKTSISDGASENDDVKVLRKRNVSITVPEKELKPKKPRRPRACTVALPLQVDTITLDAGIVDTIKSETTTDNGATVQPKIATENVAVLPATTQANRTEETILSDTDLNTSQENLIINCELDPTCQDLIIDDVSLAEAAHAVIKDNNMSSQTPESAGETGKEKQGNKDGLDLPPAHMFVRSTSVPELNLDKPVICCKPRTPEDTTTSTLVDTTASRKRKKTTAPSLSNIFDLFIPAESLSSLVFAPSNDTELTIDTSDNELPQSTPSSSSASVGGDAQKPIISVDLKLLNSLRSAIPATPIDDEPVYHSTYEDYTHLSSQTKLIQQHFTELFRKNLCTSNPNIPYIIETILYNHQHHVLQNLEEKFIVVIRNEISVRNSLQATETMPPIDVLVEFFDDVFSRLEASDYTYFEQGEWKNVFLSRLFYPIRTITKNYKNQYGSLLSFAIKLSLKWEALSHFRFYVINSILNNRQGLLQNIFIETLNGYSASLLIGHAHIGYNKDQGTLKAIDNLYLAGLEFYLRYSQIRYTPINKLTYMHQFAIEHHLLSSALEAVVVKEEEDETKYSNEQGLICLKLMLKSQGWPWLINTLLPLVFDTLGSTSEYGICRLMEVTESLISSEIVAHRADLTVLKEKYVPTLTGLLWTAPSFEIKASIAKCLVHLSPLNYSIIPKHLLAWAHSLPPHFKEHPLYETVRTEIVKLSNVAARKL